MCILLLECFVRMAAFGGFGSLGRIHSIRQAGSLKRLCPGQCSTQPKIVGVVGVK